MDLARRSHKNMEQQSQGWCESEAGNRRFRLYEKKEFAFFDVPEPEHRTKMGGYEPRGSTKKLTKMAVSQV